MGFAARVGMAFHRTLQLLNSNPPVGETANKVAEQARLRFTQELKAQEIEASKHPRERGLPREQERVNRAAEAIVVEALRLVREGGIKAASFEPDPSAASSGTQYESLIAADRSDVVSVEVEVEVKSKDGLFAGRIDRVEHLTEGTRLVDYKSALRDELPGRYERQLQLYAFMWHDTRSEWPIDAEVVYPLTASRYRVSVKPEVCQRIVADSTAVISQVQSKTSALDLGLPGDTCKVCDFRPWCRAFWKWQKDEPSQTIALQRAALGFEGEITSIAAVKHYWRMIVSWRNCTVRIVAEIQRFPQLKNASAGTFIRALDMRLSGLRYQPQAAVNEFSEIFLLVNSQGTP